LVPKLVLSISVLRILAITLWQHQIPPDQGERDGVAGFHAWLLSKVPLFSKPYMKDYKLWDGFLHQMRTVEPAAGEILQ
jgi:hypothetical protein